MSVDEILHLLDGPLDATRRKQLEEQLVEYQQQPSVIQQACSDWISCSDHRLQFFAARTILSAADHLERIDDYQHLANVITKQLQGTHLCRPAARKLHQAFALIACKAFPTRDLAGSFLQSARLPQETALCLEIAAELPLQCDRNNHDSTLSKSSCSITSSPTSNKSQYAFKHHLSTLAARVVYLIQNSCDPPTPMAIDAFANWLTIRSFFKHTAALVSAFLKQIVQTCIDTDPNANSRREALIGAVVAWLEAVECDPILSNQLSDLMPHILALRPCISHFCSQEDFDSVSSMARIFRLYGELASDVLVSTASEVSDSSDFLQTMLAFTQIEGSISTSSEIDTSLFWIAFYDAIGRSNSDRNKAEQLGHSMAPQIASALACIPKDLWNASIYIYGALFDNAPEQMWTILSQSVTSALDTERNWAIWLLSEMLRLSPPRTDIHIQLTRSAVASILHQSTTSISNLSRVLHVSSCIMDQSLRVDAVKKLLSFHCKSAKEIEAVNSSLAAIADNHVAPLIVSHRQRFADLGLKFWSVLCTCIMSLLVLDPNTPNDITPEAANQRSETLVMMAEHMTPIIGTPEGLDLFKSLVDATTNIDVLLQIPALSNLIHSVAQMFNQYPAWRQYMLTNGTNNLQAQMAERLAGCWEQVIVAGGFCNNNNSNSHTADASASTSDRILQLHHDQIQYAIHTLDALLFPMLHTVVVTHPHIAPAILEETSLRLLQMATENSSEIDTHLRIVLPLLSRIHTLKRSNTSSDLQASAISQDTCILLLRRISTRKASGESVSDEILMMSVRFIGLVLHPSVEIFDLSMTAARETLTDSQIDIFAPLIMRIIMNDPLTFGRRLESFLLSNSSTLTCSKTDIQKLIACRLPRRFASLFIALIRNPS